jgi:hypothetical protein
MNIIARTYCGVIDLYHGIPDLLNATIENVEYDNSNEEYKTILTLRDFKGNLHNITIAKG